jgi:pilus assembly protein CpaB
MQTQTMLILAVAIACAGTAGLALNGSGAGRSGDKGTVPVVVAVAEVPRGALLTSESLKIRRYPKGLAPKGAIAKIEDATGRCTLGHLIPEEVLLDSKLAEKGSRGGIAALIPNGMRAIAIQIPNVATGVAGFILPGNKVDVLINFNERPGGPPAPIGAEVLFEDVEILAVDQRIEAPAENKVDAAQMRSVTLLVTPEQASRLHEATSEGTLHLSLRNPTDTSRSAPKAARGASLLEGLGRALATAAATKAARPARPAPKVAAPPPPAPAPPRLIRTVRSNRETIVSLDPRP